MDFKYKYQIIGYKMVIHGKSKESTCNIKFIFMEKSGKQLMEKDIKDPIGRKLKLL